MISAKQKYQITTIVLGLVVIPTYVSVAGIDMSYPNRFFALLCGVFAITLHYSLGLGDSDV